jgi:uncharacterized membrane protein
VRRRDDPPGQSTEVHMTVEISPEQADINNKNITQLIYGLYAASIIVLVTSIVAIILNYVKRDDVVNTIYESHFRWQIRTFWFSLLWCFVAFASFITIVGPFIIGSFAFIWFVYRIVKGWLRLTEGKPMYVA